MRPSMSKQRARQSRWVRRWRSDLPSPQSAFVVYEPPTTGFPWLSVILLPDGTVIARRFDTPEEAAKYNSEMAKGLYTGTRKH